MIHDVPYACDACTWATPPTWRYSIPEGTPMNAEMGPGVLMLLSIGHYGMCDECHKIKAAPGSDHAKAHKIRDRMWQHPMLAALPAGPQRTLARQVAFSMLVRILGLLSDPRPSVKGEHPLDGKMLTPDSKPEAN